MLIRCIDFETCGTEPDHELVEIGWADMRVSEAGIRRGDAGRTFANPGRPIDPGSRGVHHISDHDVAGAPTPNDAIKLMMTAGGVPDVLCAHFAKYERGLYPTTKRPWLCTYKAAVKLYPDAPDHKLQTLRYFLGLDDQLGGDANAAFMPPHRALPDATLCAILLEHLCENGCTIEDMITWTDQPILLSICKFQKHRGKTWEQVSIDDLDYLYWITNKADDMDEDTKFTARHWIEARKPKRAWTPPQEDQHVRTE